MSFSSRRRNYLLTPHRRDGLIEWMKSMLQHSFVLDALETTAADTFSHFEVLIEEHRRLESSQHQQSIRGNHDLISQSHPHTGGPHHSRIPSSSSSSNVSQHSKQQQSRLQQLVPTIGSFHTPLPLREAFEIYNEKHRLTKRKHIQPSFNEIRHILNLAQILAFRKKDINGKTIDMSASGSGLDLTTAPDNHHDRELNHGQQQQLNGPRMITFDGDQTLYSDGANFESNPQLAYYIYQLLRHGVAVAVVTAAGYEYDVEKYELRLSGLLHYFQQHTLTEEECERFYLFGGECNYLLQLKDDYRLHPVRESGPGGWSTSTKYLYDSPGNWSDEEIQNLLDDSQETLQQTMEELNLKGRVIRKRRSVGLVPLPGATMTRESLDEAVLRVHEKLHHMNQGCGPGLPFCAFNGGTDAWVDCGSKRVGVRILQCYLGIEPDKTLHIGDQFLNTGNDYAARAASPCVWITNPVETSYCLKTILRLAGVPVVAPSPPETAERGEGSNADTDEDDVIVEINDKNRNGAERKASKINFEEIERRRASAKIMDVYTGEMVNRSATLN